MSPAFTLLYAQYYPFYLQPYDEVLIQWLKFCRMPHSPKVRRELEKIFPEFRLRENSDPLWHEAN